MYSGSAHGLASSGRCVLWRLQGWFYYCHSSAVLLTPWDLDRGQGLTVITGHRPVTEPDPPNTSASPSWKDQGGPQRPAEAERPSFLIHQKAGTVKSQLDCGAVTETTPMPETAQLACISIGFNCYLGVIVVTVCDYLLLRFSLTGR